MTNLELEETNDCIKVILELINGEHRGEIVKVETFKMHDDLRGFRVTANAAYEFGSHIHIHLPDDENLYNILFKDELGESGKTYRKEDDEELYKNLFYDDLCERGKIFSRDELNNLLTGYYRKFAIDQMLPELEIMNTDDALKELLQDIPAEASVMLAIKPDGTYIMIWENGSECKMVHLTKVQGEALATVYPSDVKTLTCATRSVMLANLRARTTDTVPVDII